MNGQEAIRSMRRSGSKPDAVFIDDGDSDISAVAAQDWHTDRPRFAAVQIDAGDIPEALDLRFAVGLTVHHLAMRGRERAKRMHDSLIAANAKQVITSIPDGDGIELLISGETTHG